MRQMIFSRNLVSWRRKSNITQEVMAEKCGVSRQAVTKWECGQSLPDLYKVGYIAEIFEVTVDELLFGEVEEKANKFSGEANGRKLDDILQMMKKWDKKEDVFEEYSKNYEIEDDQADIYYDAGCEAASNGNYEDAILLLEQALTHGQLYAAPALTEVYTEILDVLLGSGDEELYRKYNITLAEKTQQYGKILVAEIKRIYGV